MRHQRLAVLVVAGLFIGPVLADRKKAGPCEVTPPASAPAPADKPCPPGLTLPSPNYLQQPPQYCPDPAARLQQLLNESEALRQSRLNGAIGAQLPLKTYSVADLVVPIPPAGSPPTA